MIRCPFNNFSKCDGSCPWSQPNFTDCGLRADLAEVNGKASGILARLSSADDRLKELGDILAMTHDAVDALKAKAPTGCADGTKKQNMRLSDPRSYIRRDSDGKCFIYLSLEDSDAIKATGWESVNFETHTRPRPSLYLFEGSTAKVCSTHKSERMRVYLPKGCGEPFVGEHTAAFVTCTFGGDELLIEPDGEVVG